MSGRLKLKHSAVNETVYTPDGLRHMGIRIWGKMGRDLWSARELIWRLVRRDISVRYRQSVFGYLWAVIPQIAMVMVFTFLTSQRILPIGEVPLPYPVFALWNLAVWHLFTQSLTACTTSLSNAGPLVSKINFPKEALVLSAIGQPVVDFLIRLLPIIAVFAWYEITPPVTVLWIPLMLVPVLLLAAGFGFFLSVLNLVMRDVANALGVFLTLAIFVTPVLYPPPVTSPFLLVNILNPFSPLLIGMQDVLTIGALSQVDMFFAATLFSMLVFTMGWRFFLLSLPRIAERA